MIERKVEAERRRLEEEQEKGRKWKETGLGCPNRK